MHNVVPGAKAYILALQLALQRARVRIICNATVDQLRFDDEHRVTGVHATIDGEAKQFSASRGVILTAGDYAKIAKTSPSTREIGSHQSKVSTHFRRGTDTCWHNGQELGW